MNTKFLIYKNLLNSKNLKFLWYINYIKIIKNHIKYKNSKNTQIINFIKLKKSVFLSYIKYKKKHLQNIK